MTNSGDSDMATQIKSSALKFFFDFSPAQMLDSASRARYRRILYALYFNAGGVDLSRYIDDLLSIDLSSTHSDTYLMASTLSTFYS